MTKLHRLIKRCIEQNNPNLGTAESFSNALKDLGRWVLTLYSNGKLTFEGDKKHNLNLHEVLNIKDYVNEIGEQFIGLGYFDGRERDFFEMIALCHKDLSQTLEEFYNGYHPCYTYYREDSEPKGIPAELANVIIRIFEICYQYDIDIETLLLEKFEYIKHKNSAST
ncbi:hypothetical protein [Anaerocolumna sp. MB42-C2]|uniref:hypothetical protein n=1 Tax=Anaerocolumna sp. MB42-C2 TaxID=3070997 RepID=UPI0027E1AB25|nr:hypothetical protein [Anaerocolumna sp. MB42-C2]WMJ88073.1 hypothetical protein RBU59_00805 [Anaerocolumna sp. MB42-C2]